MSMLEPVARLLEDAVDAGHPPAAQACAMVGGRVVHESAHGASPDGTAVTAESVFDVASVTKVAATTLSIAALIEEGELALDTPLSRWLPELGARDAREVTARELLGHRSGLPAWQPFFLEATHEPSIADARRKIVSAVLDARFEPRGRRVYSDLGFIALGELIERVSGVRLDAFVRDRVFAPLGLTGEMGFVDLAGSWRWTDARHVLPTGRTRPREPAPGQEALYSVPPQAPRDDPGRVDDDNAFAMGGVAGHAGLFATARALASLGTAILEELEGGRRRGPGATLRKFAALDPAEGPRRALGFDVPAIEGSSAGTLLGRGTKGALGQLGFTGCSLWIDRDRRLSVALLTNRTYPGRHHVEPIRALRPAFHDALCRAIA